MPSRAARYSLLLVPLVLAAASQHLLAQTCGNSPPPEEGSSLHGPNAARARTRQDFYSVSVISLDGSIQAIQGSSGNTTKFLVQNTGDCPDGYGFAVSKWGTITSATASPTSLSLDPGQSDTVTVTFTAGASPGGSITVTATGSFASNSHATVSVTVVPASGAPIVDTSPYNFDNQDYSRCAASCFAAMHAQSTVPYFSLDTPRSVTLVYNSDRVKPRPFVHVNVSPDLGYGRTPTEYQLRAKINDVRVTFVNNDSVLRFAYITSAPLRIGGQLDRSGDTTGVYKLEIDVTAVYASPTTVITNSFLTKLLIVNFKGKPVARGWNIGGAQRLYAYGDSAFVVDGDGSATYFDRDPSFSYVSPAGEFSRLIAGAPGGGSGWTRLYPDSTKVGFNSAGRMTDIRDRFNNITSITYDGSNRVWKITDPQNLTIILTYDANGLDAITDPMGRVTQVTVNSDTSLTLIQDPDLVGTTFAYDVNKRLSTITDRRGFLTTLGYDSNSRKLATTTAPSVSFVASSGADSTGSPVSLQAAWQVSGVPYGGTGGTAFTAPRADTVYARMTDPAGHITRFTVNRWGAPAVTTDPMGRSDSTWFDGNGMPIRARYSSGAVDSAAYNSSGFPVWQRKSGFPSVNIRYAGWAEADSIWTNGDSTGVRRFIGVNGRVDWVRRAGGTSDSIVTRYHYDIHGRPDSVLDAMNHLVQRTWYSGLNGNRSKDSTAETGRVVYGYDAYGRVTSRSRPGFATQTTYYSIINRPDSLRDGADALPARYSYDNLFLTGFTDPKGQVYGFSHNALGLLTQRTDPTSHAAAYKYSRDGLLRRWIDRRGYIISYTYDAAHRPLQKSGDTTTTETLAYPSDTVMVATSPSSQDTTVMNRHGQLIRASTVMAGQVFSRRYVYTTQGALDSVVPSSAGILFRSRKYIWNSRTGALRQIRLGTDTTQLVTNRDGLSTVSVLPGSDSILTSYTSGHAEGAVTIGGPAWGPTLTRYLNFTTPGRIREQVLGSGQEGRQFTYDSLGRLTSDSAITWQGPDSIPPCANARYPETDDNGSVCVADEFGGGHWIVGAGSSFSYDSAGNRRDKGGQYGVANRITQFDGCTYQTDLDGNVVQRACGNDTLRLTWSADSRLTTMSAAGRTITFSYNSDGHLIRKDVNGFPQAYFLWDRGDLLAELDGAASTKILEYAYTSTDVPYAVVLGNETLHAHRDGLGNVIGLTDSMVTPRSLYDYDAWGQNLGAGPDTLNRARFKGALWIGSDVEIYFMRARWYEPKTGRFLSEDPLGLEAGINQYAFSSDDPINHSDPEGLDALEIDDPCPDGYHVGTVQVVELDGATGLTGKCVSNSGTGPDQPYWVVLDFVLAPVTVTGSPGSPEGSVSTAGYGSSLFIGLGGTLGFGTYEYENGWHGVYLYTGVGGGLDVGAAPEAGGADNLDVLKGGSGQAAGSALILGHSRSFNGAGQAWSTSAGWSRFPLGGHFAYTYGFVSDPKPPEVGTMCVDYWHDWICK
jgi:RHS repeat-associated protein